MGTPELSSARGSQLEQSSLSTHSGQEPLLCVLKQSAQTTDGVGAPTTSCIKARQRRRKSENHSSDNPIFFFSWCCLSLKKNYCSWCCINFCCTAKGFSYQFSSVTQSCLTLCDPHGLQHTRPPCPSPTPGACSNSCPWSQWCRPTIASAVEDSVTHIHNLFHYDRIAGCWM